MSITTRKHPTARGLAALAAASLVALPASASAHGGGERAGGDRAAAVKAPSRVADRAARAVKAVSRATDAIDDGDAAKATAALTAARTNLASALKSASKAVTAKSPSGPVAAAIVLDAQHRVAAGAANDVDGQDGTVVDDLATTLKAADDGRDALVAAIGALSADDRAGYADALGGAADDVAEELSDLADALSDDTLTTAAKDALTAAQTQDTATAAAIKALLDAQGSASSGDVADHLDGASYGSGGGAPRGDCPRGGRTTSGSGTGTVSGYLES